MERVSIIECLDWCEKVIEYGFNFYIMYGEFYWSEEVYYKLIFVQVEKLEVVIVELYQMCFQVVEKVIVSDELMIKFCIFKYIWGFVCQLWKINQLLFYLCFDLVWDGIGELKLLENNVDILILLYEVVFFQWIWLEDQFNVGKLLVGSDQFNSLQEKLIDCFGELCEQFGFQLLYMVCCCDIVEDCGIVQYLQDCVVEVGLVMEFFYVEDIGLGEKGQFIDLQDQVIGNLFKFYLWEFMLWEMFFIKLEDVGVCWLELVWKSIIFNKVLLLMLWEMFFNYFNLLVVYFSEDVYLEMEKYVIKLIFFCEGVNVLIVENGKVVEVVEGLYGEEGIIVQVFYLLLKFGDSYMLIGSWFINDQFVGIGICEDWVLIIQDLLCFYLYIFVE